jgi:D-arabinitol 4-dehydrogenase
MPEYRDLPGRILHLGLGAFHRAHQVAVLQALHDRGDTRWRLAAGNLRGDNAATEAALVAQRGAYVLETVTPAGARSYQRISALGEVVPHAPGQVGLIALGADPATRIISFTVTEAGYALDADDRLGAEGPDIRADLRDWREGRAGRTVYGALAGILDARRTAGAGPVTLLCCDNLRHNGGRSRAGLLQFLALAGDDRLREWVLANTTSPDTMVDRITPRPTGDVAARVLAATGVDDAAPVMAEDFLQWVVQEDFCNGRPDWEAVGVEMTSDVAPYEEAKIRLLNAVHSGIAWAGSLAGYDSIDAAVADPAIRRIVHAYATDDAIPCLQAGAIDLPAYRDRVLERFGNDALGDTVERVCADSWAKLAGFIVPTLRDRLRAGHSPRSAALLPALYLAFLQRWQAGAIAFEVRDATIDRATAAAICADPDPVAAFCAQRALWDELAGDPRLVALLREARERAAAFEDAARHAAVWQ